MKKPIYQKDKILLTKTLSRIKPEWDGKKAILKLKKIDYQWRQMEWMGFYFEALCHDLLTEKNFQIPGKKYGRTKFDSLSHY